MQFIYLKKESKGIIFTLYATRLNGLESLTLKQFQCDFCPPPIHKWSFWLPIHDIVIHVFLFFTTALLNGLCLAHFLPTSFCTLVLLTLPNNQHDIEVVLNYMLHCYMYLSSLFCQGRRMDLDVRRSFILPSLLKGTVISLIYWHWKKSNTFQ